MAAKLEPHDPLLINLNRQICRLREQLPLDSPHHTTLSSASSRSDLLNLLSRLLSTPGYTITVATLFRPILIDLAARWLLDESELVDKLEASALLLEIHPELFPIFFKLMSQEKFIGGPLCFLQSPQSLSTAETGTLHRLLLAYYRVLHANNDFPRLYGWSLNHLSRLVWEGHPDAGVRFLAIRCYALQSGMIEAERLKMEKEAVGDIAEVDCPIEYDAGLDGTRQVLDGWTVPAHEAQRVFEARQALLTPQKYYSYEEGDSIEPIHPAELSSLIANVHGILMLRSSNSQINPSRLVSTSTTARALRDLAVNLSLNVPTLLTSPPSSGKSLLLTHLAAMIHPDIPNQVITIHLADTSLDPRSLLGSYVSSPTRPGTFDWKEGVLVKAMREGRWVVFEDIDRGSNEVLGLIKPLVETLGLDKWIGGQAEMEVPGRGLTRAAQGFSIFATRSLQSSRSGLFPSPTFFGAHKFYEVVVQSPTHDDLLTIVNVTFPRLAGAVAKALVQLWEAVSQLGSTASTRDIGMRELERLCLRVDKLLPSLYQPMDVDSEGDPTLSLSALLPNPTIREDIFFESRDVFFGAGTTTAAARMHVEAISSTIAEYLGLSPERRDWVLSGRISDYIVDKDVNGTVTSVTLGQTKLVAAPTKPGAVLPMARSFAMHKPAISLLSRIASAISLQEPILLTGETGTGKTSVVTHLASLLRKPLISLNLSNQTEASDILGGFKPVDARIPATELYERFLEIFGGTFSRKKNAHFEDSVRKAVQEGKWKRAVALWLESTRLAKERIQARLAEDTQQSGESDMPRKRRKTENGSLNVSESDWSDFERDVRTFDVQHVQGNGKFAFAFVEGPLVKALRMGHWILLDEVNLASAETLECVSSLLHGPTASITLTEQGSLEPVPRHPEFRLFACMNPATDVGKKDLPPNIRSRFTEIDVPPPDADRETLLSIVAHYIGSYAVGDKGAIMDVAEFYAAVRTLAERREIADGSNHRPHFSMRTLARALTFAADLASTYSLRRALWEGSLMAFTMILDASSAAKVTALAQKHILAGVRNVRSLLLKEPLPPQGRDPEDFVKFGPFYLERGPLSEDLMEEYIMTPSVETKLVDLARIIVTRRFPVLIEGPTSSGKTSSIEYLARRTGHRFVRINNHEHTDIQEYLGTYVSDPATGKLVFKDGLLVRALRNGDWIVLDELNLAPTDVLEALNRLLDDNRELVVPETQEVVRPHPHFMLFATQNPPGLYGGRKVLSRAFRNRFLEVHFEDVPQAELETILCQRCRIAPSYGQRIVTVFQELQKRRQSSRIFESKHGFATLRDLFRWASRDAIDYQELADNGFMLLAERARREEDKQVVKEVIESIMKVSIDPTRLYALHNSSVDLSTYLGCSVPESSQLVWTSAMRRLFTLLARALRFNEPVLLVGETGCGKTSVCQVFAQITGKDLLAVNCHQNTETADLIGGLRPLRNRTALEQAALSEGVSLLKSLGQHILGDLDDVAAVTRAVDKLLDAATTGSNDHLKLLDTSSKLHRLDALFEWHDGPLIQAMRTGNVFLMDEISLADDSVLERLNSVLETGRTIVLAEQGGAHDLPSVSADEGFKLVATMNPGGDYGKKELSPALRNRFTEIWVPAVDTRSDLEMIIRRSWRHSSLEDATAPVLDFTEWLVHRIGDRSIVTLRDILALIEFVNVNYHPERPDTMPLNSIFHHAAHMTFLDGLGSLPQLSAFSATVLSDIRAEASSQLDALFPLPISYTDKMIAEDTAKIQLGSFSVPRGALRPNPSPFSFQAPTTRDNVNRVVRACQLPKPILLEGSPGVGKTSLVAALANVCGYHLCRINLSDQTDVVDLFGSDLPVEGGAPGQFAWKDAEFLRALQEGHWVLLDEMNLAPQAILEGLNAVLDHRGTVYIPELGRTFTRHPSFRIFAAQNPLQQGGGRKGLPKSFLNRFTKVYVQELSKDDTLIICRALYPTMSTETLQGMINFADLLNEEIMVKRTFAREGSPWEFNLRDVLRWGSLIQHSELPHPHPAAFVDILFLQRFRTLADRKCTRALLNNVFPDIDEELAHVHPITVSSSHIQVGRYVISRQGHATGRRPGRVLLSQLEPLQALSSCVQNRWLAILTGQRNSGKNSIVRLMAHLTGNVLQEIPINIATDTTDILGSFEEVDARGQVAAILRSVVPSLEKIAASSQGSRISLVSDMIDNVRSLLSCWSDDLFAAIHQKIRALQVKLDFVDFLGLPTSLNALLQSVLAASDSTHKFEWIDGPLVRALKAGYWVLLDGANLCNPSVLDRLNALCETNGVLTLNERGAINGEVEVITPHPDFRLFMSVDTHFGELSRAMRNRGVEVALVDPQQPEDTRRILDFLRIPAQPAQPQYILASDTSLLRRGAQIEDIDLSMRRITPSARFLQEDTAASGMLDLLLSLPRTIDDAEVYVTTYAITPSQLELSLRFVRSASSTRKQWANILKSLEALPRSDITDMVTHVRNVYSLRSALPSDVIHSQPLDIQMVEGAGSSTKTPALTALLRFFVALRLFGLPNLPASTQSSSEARIRDVITDIVPATILTCSRICSEIDLTDPHAEVILGSGIQLLSFVRYLDGVRQHGRLDHSAVHVVTQWLTGCVRDFPIDIPSIGTSVKALARTVSLSSGLGLSEIWSSLAKSTVQGAQTSKLARLDDMARNLPEKQRALRQRIFELMNIELVENSMTDMQKDSLTTLTRDLQSRLSDVGSHETPNGGHNGAYSISPVYLVVEACLLSTVCLLQEHSFPEAFICGSGRLVRLAVEDPRCSLSRYTWYQHVLWENQLQQTCHASMAVVYRQWLADVWDIPSRRELDGPSLLLSPIILDTTISQCVSAEQSLDQLSIYAADVNRQLQLVTTVASMYNSRRSHFRYMLHQMMALISSCFRPDFAAEDYTWIQDACRSSDEVGMPVITSGLVNVLQRTSHSGLRSAVQEHMQPIVSASQSSGSDVHSLDELGRYWIGFAQLLLQLYVPSDPIDPAALQRCSTDFWEGQGSLLREQVSILTDYLECTIGVTANGTTKYLLESANALPAPPRTQIDHESGRRTDLGRLHTYWSEVHQFLTQILPQSKINHYLASVRSGESAASVREGVIQASITAFSQRLSTTYPDFMDINGPLHLALSSMKLGLRLVLTSSIFHATSITCPTLVPVLQRIMAFPSISSAELLRKHSIDSAIPASLSTILAQLTGILFEIRLGSEVELHMASIAQLYDQAFSLWSIDRTREEERAREAQSLYRRHNGEDEATEAELEEQDFLSIFPEFGDALDVDDTSRPRGSRIALLVTEPSALSLYQTHHELFLGPCLPLQSTEDQFCHRRRSVIQTVIETTSLPLPESLDACSLPFQLGFAIDQLEGLQGSSRASQRPYDFYLDENIPEIRRAIDLLRSLLRRLDIIISEWPDQMVLHHLKGRCEAIMQISFRSPVAKLLSTLEQLLTNVDDWEMYANRDNSLKTEQQAITALIISWRRLELSAWQGLLEKQAIAFTSSTSEWWFRLYDASIRGVLNFYDASSGKESAALTPFLEQLVPLLDEFVTSSPLGQFQSRLSLLQSMEMYASYLARMDEPHATLLHRVQCVLHNSRQYYSQFTSRVSTSLADQRSTLEKEIRNFIKLASWRDVNVHALRQSAQKTHRQLYKIIRKFREVLRQPVTPFLVRTSTIASNDSSCTEIKQVDFPHTGDLSSKLALVSPASGRSPHLVNLARTFQTFVTLIRQRIGPSLGLHHAHDVEGLAEHIISTSRALSDVHIPSQANAERRVKTQKNLLTRKRKACSDVMKELKRAGVASSIKPEVLDLHRSQCWPREQPVFPVSRWTEPNICKTDEYLYRLFGEMAELRTILSGHHPDIPTRDLQRANLHAESLLSAAIRVRTSLVTITSHFDTVKQMYDRLQMTVTSPRVVAFGSEVADLVLYAKETAKKVSNAIQELSRHMIALQSNAGLLDVPSQLLKDFESTIDSFTPIMASLEVTWAHVRLSAHHVLLEDEHKIIQHALAHVDRVANSISAWLAESPQLRVFLEPVLLWLKSRDVPQISAPEMRPAASSEDQAIDVLLLAVQNSLALCSMTSDNVEEERDNYIRDDCDFICRLSDKLGLPSVTDGLHQVFVGLPGASQSEVQNSLARLLPFLQYYMWLVNAHIENQAEWSKALFKLNHVLCSVTLTIAKDGFCQPKDSEVGEGDEESQETIEGAGLGEGTGAENVSKDVQDESQVEGLQGEEERNDEKVERAKEGDAIEMSEDFGGQMQDVPDAEDDDIEGESESAEEDGPEEKREDLDPSDENAIDEKLWGDEQGPDTQEQSGKTNQDHSTEKTDKSEMVGEDGESRKEKEKPEDVDGEAQTGESIEQDAMDDQGEEPNGSDGAPVDEHIQEADTLDLPEDLQLDNLPDSRELDMDEDMDEDMMDEDQGIEEQPGDVDRADTDSTIDERDAEEAQGLQEEGASDQKAEDDKETAVAEADTHAGNGSGLGEQPKENDTSQIAANEDQENGSGSSGQNDGPKGEPDEEKDANADIPTSSEPRNASNSAAEPSPNDRSDSGDATGTRIPGAEIAPQARSEAPIPNPLRSLGDALKEVAQRFNEILDRPETGEAQAAGSDSKDTQQLEYALEDETQADMQALGPARQDEVAKLRDLKILDEEQETMESMRPFEDDMQVDEPSPSRSADFSSLQAEATSRTLQEGVESALTPAEIASRQPATSIKSDKQPVGIAEALSASEREESSESVELEVREWQSRGQPSGDAEHIWRRYESLTHDLSYALCEQLRLILEPTMATRLRGDYRTGKRLNMKKIIPYIASEYTKDKIWLRRTRPSQREYQVLIALDDSRSMAESHSVHLAFQTLALVSKALSRLEVGDVAIAKFGQSVDILHAFEGSSFTDQSGAKIMDAFHFDQKATQVLSLLETSLTLLEQARERRTASSSTAADLWQLEIIISDGICQDHERLRTVLRKAEEQRVMVVFIILDSLRSSASSAESVPTQNSILSMNQVAYKDVNGRMELTVSRYLDSFPFEFYVVVRDVEALPEVLAGTLKQFFERISEQ